MAFSLNEFPPLALGYLKAALLNSALKNKMELVIINESVVDYPARKKSVISKLVKNNPGVLLFSCYVWNLKEILELSYILKKSIPDVKIILGGPAVTYNAESILIKNSSVDIIIMGEGEITFVELIAELIKDKPNLSNINGITFRHDDKIINNRPRKLITNLDKLASPYLVGNLEVGEKALIETHRGCFFKCGYCLEFKGSPIREFSAERIRQELQYVVENGATKITLCNSIFNTSLERVGALCNLLHEFKTFDLEINVDSYAEWLSKEMIDLYSYAGITGTEIGLQSVNENVLRNIRRPPLNKENFKEKIKLLDSSGIKTCLHVILGLPEDTLNSFQQTLAYAFSAEPTDVSIFKLLLLPGSELESLAKKFNIKYNPEPPYEVISTSTMSSDDIRRAELFSSKGYKEFILKRPSNSSK